MLCKGDSLVAGFGAGELAALNEYEAATMQYVLLIWSNRKQGAFECYQERFVSLVARSEEFG